MQFIKGLIRPLLYTLSILIATFILSTQISSAQCYWPGGNVDVWGKNAYGCNGYMGSTTIYPGQSASVQNNVSGFTGYVNYGCAYNPQKYTDAFTVTSYACDYAAAPSSCPNGLNYSTYGPGCTCPYGQVQSGSSCVSQSWTQYCTPVGDANPNQVWEYDNSSPRNYRNTGQVCCSANGSSSRTACAPSSCSNGLSYSTYGPGCTCPYGQVQSGSSCVSQSCPNGLNISSYPSCTCPYGQTQSGSSCVSQSWTQYCTPVGDANPNQVWEYDNSSPRNYRNTGQVCCSANGSSSRTACVSNTSTNNNTTNTTVAPVVSGNTLTVSKCSNPNVNLNWNSSNCTADTISGGSANQFCNFFPSPEGRQTINTSNVYASGGNCTVSFSCNGGAASSQANLVVTNAGCNNTQSCPNGLNISSYPSCTCPYGQTQSGSSCVSQSCPNGLNYSTYGHGCTCPYGQTQSGSSCVTASAPVCGSTANTCSSGDLVNDYFSGASATWQCMNSVGTKTSCSSSCPSGQTYTCNGTLAGSGICLGTLSCNTIAYTISLSGSNCTINPGQSSCQGTLNWSSTYPTYQSWNITGPGAPTGGYASWNGSSHLGNGYPTLPYGVGIYYYNAGSKTTSYSLQATCATGTTWDGSKCACPAGYAISGTQCIKYAASISATPTCNIVPGRSTCKSTLNWSATSNANSGWTISSSPNSSPSTVNVQGNNNTGSQAVDVTNGTTIFTLNTGGTITPNPTANTVAKCQDTGTAWDGSKCPLTLDLPTSYENEKGKDFTMTWKSNGNECVIKDNNNQPIATTTSSTNNFSYNFSVAANPYLNTNGNYKYNVSCYYKNGTDYGTPITKSTTLTVYEKVTAYITDNNNGSATLGCKGSWNTASLIASTTSGVNTRQFTNDGTNIFPITYSLSGNPTLTLTCVGKNTDVAILPKGTLSLAGTVSSATRAPISTSTVTSSDEIMYIDYTSSNGVFDISYTATGVTAIQYAEVIGDPNVNPSTITALDSNKPISDTILNASYPSGATIKIVATKNGIYKTLILRLRNSQTPKAQLTNLSTSNVSGVCYNSTSYDLKLGGVSVKSGSIAAANFDSYNINYNYTMPPLLSKQSVSLTCGFAGNTDTATGEVIDASKQTAEILRFSAYPPELACGGGKAILTWEVKYSAGKNCHIESEVTTKNSSVLNADKTLALSKISSAINTDSNYKTLIATTTKVTKGNIFDITDSNYISKGQLSNVVTTFSTRYYLVCGDPAKNIPITSRSADVDVVCTGQQ